MQFDSNVFFAVALSRRYLFSRIFHSFWSLITVQMTILFFISSFGQEKWENWPTLTEAKNAFTLKPGFHIVVYVVSVVRKKFIGQIQLYGNLLCKCSIQKKRQIQLVVRDRMNSICPMNFFRTTDTTDTTIWKPGFNASAIPAAPSPDPG